MEEIIQSKADIMEQVRAYTVDKFMGRGINITVLGMKDGITYDDKKIQEAINASFTAEKNYLAQQITNKNNKEKAESDKIVKITQAQAEAEAVSIIQEQLSANPTYIDYIKAQKWNGVMPTTVVSGQDQGLMINMAK
jgi:regulator of protease activity HflC (stomatin/prohibitin superfamily)